MVIKLAKEFYNKEIITKAAFLFTNDYYISLDADAGYFYVSIERKDGVVDPSIEKEFVNEMLAQSVRHLIYKQTKGIRELLLARAMATSVITDTDNDEGNDEVDFSEDEILKDWFYNND